MSVAHCLLTLEMTQWRTLMSKILDGGVARESPLGVDCGGGQDVGRYDDHWVG